MTISDVGRVITGATKPSSPARSAFAGAASAKGDQTVAEFLKEAKKTPIQRFKGNFLKSRGLTEEQFDALPPEKRAAILREMEEAMKKAVKGPSDGTASAGSNANMLV
ncbi:hypothetical protein [Sphingomonas sp. BAUL-RG-20F-R05-02]|uniref:hypothetical protein n=1 Tax=Sphingomonas sp. BAUL-RG-20F-R05-02 TaxID=2914830 RepID=UPI001F57FCFE|nr:hypothetical protein [Sphingomonas sp. BAUL-RG-20F-R05-02]